MRSTTITAWLATLALAAAAVPAAWGGQDEPERVTVQHILVGFKRSVPNKKLERTKSEAKALAYDLLRRARDGEEFDALVREFTDDNYPGVYVLINKDGPRSAGTFPREQMAVRFGDVAFRLEVGEIDIADYHAGLSPYGWHVIKRLE